MKVKQEVIKKLKGLKKFNISWVDEVHKSIEVEAVDKEEAKKMFDNWEIDEDTIEEGDINMNEYSLEVERIE